MGISFLVRQPPPVQLILTKNPESELGDVAAFSSRLNIRRYSHALKIMNPAIIHPSTFEDTELIAKSKHLLNFPYGVRCVFIHCYPCGLPDSSKDY